MGFYWSKKYLAYLGILEVGASSRQNLVLIAVTEEARKECKQMCARRCTCRALLCAYTSIFSLPFWISIPEMRSIKPYLGFVRCGGRHLHFWSRFCKKLAFREGFAANFNIYSFRLISISSKHKMAFGQKLTNKNAVLSHNVLNVVINTWFLIITVICVNRLR